jgi:hypothetical protein
MLSLNDMCLLYHNYKINFKNISQLTPQLTPLLELQSGVSGSFKGGVSWYLTVVYMPLVLVIP